MNNRTIGPKTLSLNEKAFAEIVAEKTEKAETIRTVVMSTDTTVQNQFLKDNMCAGINITNISNK